MHEHPSRYSGQHSCRRRSIAFEAAASPASDVLIQVDGGVDERNVNELVAAGARLLVVGSHISVHAMSQARIACPPIARRTVDSRNPLRSNAAGGTAEAAIDRLADRRSSHARATRAAMDCSPIFPTRAGRTPSCRRCHHRLGARRRSARTCGRNRARVRRTGMSCRRSSSRRRSRPPPPMSARVRALPPWKT